jgi:uncharacterized protein
VYLLVLSCTFVAVPTHAQSFDCAKARTAVETAICADASLKAQDTQLGQVYTQLLAATQAREPDAATRVREEQRRWVQERDRRCAARGETAARIKVCLMDLYRTRLAALTAVMAAAPALPPLPPEPAAHLSGTAVSASAAGQVLLTVDVAGRFAIRAESKTGVALQLIDMITGPGTVAGEAGVRDGRLDVLLDTGVYKLRSFGAPGATGEAQLRIEPFRHAAPASTALLHGGTFSGELTDLQQRSYWILLGGRRQVAVDAVGRAVQDMRLWHNGVELAALTPDLASLETRPGHTMTRARLEGQVTPGLYLVTVYGGTSLPWGDEDNAQPLHVRVGDVRPLAGGVAEGSIGPFGSVRFEAPPPDTYARLEVPSPVPARLVGGRKSGSIRTASITKTSREPVATLTLPLAGNEPARLEVIGFEGQPFRLRTLQPTTTLRVDGSGPHLVAVDVAGEGSDELPATAVFARFDKGRMTVLASHTPRLGPGQAWRRKFNLRGAATVLFEMTGAGPIAAQVSGPGVRLALEPLLGNTAPRADGRQPWRWQVEPGWYVLKIDPINNAAGILDLTLGQPGLAAEVADSPPPRSVLRFGIHNLLQTAQYQIFTNTAPGLVLGPKARALPADLALAPLGLSQAAAEAIDVPVHLPVGGLLHAVDPAGVPVTFTTADETPDKTGRTLTVHFPPSDRERVLALAWTPDTVLPELPRLRQQASDTLPAGQPRFFSLKRDEQRSMRLEVQAGGLYRVESLGRLKTSVQVSTPFLPDLASAADNGPGHNGLLQSYLRAGVYRATVTAHESAGHLGLVATPAILEETSVLVTAGSVRASLAAGRGALVPIEIAVAGLYRLDLYGLDRVYAARLEDAEGWPLSPPGDLSHLEQRFEPGRYRLVVVPADVDTRMVARLQAVTTPVPLAGHGPHALPFDQVQHFQWREPETREAPRPPDRWTFALYGTAPITLDISDGMIAELLREGEETAPLAKLIYKRGFAGPLPAGRYVVEARSLGRNDRLDYDLSLRTTAMQPGQVRLVHLPAKVPFAIAQDRIVSVTTFGRTALSGVLQDASGRVVERLTGRSDDWNLALSRHLSAGSYQLELSKALAESTSTEETDDASARDNAATATDNAETDIEVHLALPVVEDAGVLSFDAVQTLSGAQAHQFALPTVEAGNLMLVAAQASAELALSLERRDATAGWHTVGFERGKAPVLAVPSDGNAQRPWRVTVWAIDGGVAPWRIAARAQREALQAPGQVVLTPLRLEGLTIPLVLAQVTAPASAMLVMRGAPEAVNTGSTPGRLLGATTGDLLVPQTEQLWLLARASEPTTVMIEPVRLAHTLALTLNAGESARIPGAPVASGQMRFWHAASAFGQPGLDAGRGMGVAAGSAFAQDHGATLRVWNADSDTALRLRITAIDTSVLPGTSLDAHYAGLIPARSAQPFTFTPGARQLDVSLAAGMGAILSGGEAPPTTVWAGERAVSRLLSGGWSHLLLLNTGAVAAPATVDVTPGADGVLSAGQVIKRFFGASGSLEFRVAALAGDRLVVAGAQATFIASTGQVQRGTALLLPGPGALVLDYDPGLVAAWIERDGQAPWPSAVAQQVTLPQSLSLAGEAMTLALTQPGPVLLRARTTAPVILSLRQGDAPAPPVLFSAGAVLYRYLATGNAELRLYTPYDGPLSGSLELSATPIASIGEGLGEPRVLAPGGSLLFGFEVLSASDIGAGVRSEPDRAEVRLLGASGWMVGEGMAQMRRLEPGRYVLEVRAPAQGATLTVRPALVGLTPSPAGPPPDVVATYLDMVGLTPSGAR